MGGGKRGTTGKAAGEGTGRGRAKDAAGEPGRRGSAGREDAAARPGGMALVDPWGALLAGLLVAEEEPATDDAGGEARGEDGREPSDPIAPAKARRTGTRRGRPRGPAGGR